MSKRQILIYLVVIAAPLVILVPGLALLAHLMKLYVIKERITIGKVDKAQEAIHRARYEFAKQYCAGKRVADIAAGEGYGTAMLREVAASVDPYDREKFGDNILIDLEKQKWSKKYDVIVSLETIEHLANPEFFLENVRESCSLAVISTPVNEEKDFNPHHKQIWTSTQLRALLERFFTCEYHGQKGNQFPLDANPPFQMVAICRPK